MQQQANYKPDWDDYIQFQSDRLFLRYKINELQILYSFMDFISQTWSRICTCIYKKEKKTFKKTSFLATFFPEISFPENLKISIYIYNLHYV